jgi:excisionase family DNA binding protein
VDTPRHRPVTLGEKCHTARVPRRFLTLADVAETLNVSASQVYALVRNGELPAIKLGGRGQWRVEETALDSFIADRYHATERFIAEHPFGREPSPADPGDA